MLVRSCQDEVENQQAGVDEFIGEIIVAINQRIYLFSCKGFHTIEIIAPLAARTRGIYDGLIKRGYSEYEAISTKQADGYYGWEDAAPFDQIIVTCGIDHVPPPLLEQLKPNGVMVIPIGPPGAQHVLKVVKAQADDGSVVVKRSDIYNGRVIPFVPFTSLDGDKIKGTHNG